MEDNNLDCPVDFVPINENRARLTALFVLVLMLLYLNNGLRFILFFLFVDFTMRAFKWGQYSLLGMLSNLFIKLFKFKNKQVDRAPKRFAAGMGMAITGLMLVLLVFKAVDLAYILGVIIVVFATLESALGFCAGCYVYTFIKKFI